ncbi:hypothetical protein [Streptococcus uberis]|uniref:hypothetical protein n=1 Tax=Streptococcus uberis TaxID=1349 RepID=UPI001FF1A3DD|nr:hypothetical protein [Streptococcus uberis]MCK1227504.1 hypothetical protein [Streptococcus uberis]
MKTKSGFEFKISKARLDNYELVEALGELEINPLKLPSVLNLLLGDQVNKLKDHLRDKDGFVSTESIMNEVKEIFELSKAKN